MNRRQAIEGHKKRLANLTDDQASSLMEHAANKTPLMACDKFHTTYVDPWGKC